MRKKLVVALVIVMFFSMTAVFAVQEEPVVGTDSSVYAMIVLPVVTPVDVTLDKNFSIISIVESNVKAILELREAELTRRFPEIIIRHQIDYIFVGISFVSSEVEYNEISKLSWISDIYKIGEYKPTGNLSTAEMVHATSVYDLVDENNTSLGGNGVLIGVIDSGIDYNHKHLGNGIFGEAGKVVGGTNYVENGKEPIDDAPICHGTCVAGLIAGDRDTISIAPLAKLMSYRVFSNNSPAVKEDTIVRAINQAVKDECNVINISLSEPGGTSKTPSLVGKAVEKAIKSGVVVVGAAGDFGTYCNFSDKGTVGGSALSQDAICVGSMDSRPGFNVRIEDTNFLISGLASIPYSNLATDRPKSIVNGGYGSEDELSSISIRGKIVLIKRGPSIGRSIPFYIKMLNAKRKGAIGMICWNNVPGELLGMQVGYNDELGIKIREKDSIPSCFISNGDGKFLSKLINEGSTSVVISEKNYNSISRTSSLGPSEDLIFKPDVCAPGVGLIAPISLIPGSSEAPYTNSFSGTSASTAIVSGAVALIRQYKPEWTPRQIRLALMNTATLARNQVNGSPSSMLIQGAGKINVDAAIKTPAIIEPAGVIAKATEEITFTLEGLGQGATFKVRIEVPKELSDVVEFDISNEDVVVSSDGAATLGVTAFFNQAKIPCNIECVVWFESGDTKLHVPFICWKGFSSAESTNITGLKVGGKKIDYSSTDLSGITICYNIAMGDLYAYKPFAYGKYSTSEEVTDTNETVISKCQVDLVDGNNDTWVTIKQCENVEYGHYCLDWNGELSISDQEVPNGNYKIKLTRTESRIGTSGASSIIFSDSIVADQPIRVIGSQAEVPPKFRLYARPGVPSIDQKFVIDLYIMNAKDVSSISMDIMYPSEEIEILDVIAGDFMGLDGVAVENDMFNEEEEGKIRLFSKRLGEKGIDGYGLIARFIARCSDVVYPTIGYSDKRILDSDGNLVRHMSFPLELETIEDEPLFGDLNFDGVVNSRDVIVIARSFGLTTRHPDYNIVADINDDGRVDNGDLKILLANFGKSN